MIPSLDRFCSEDIETGIGIPQTISLAKLFAFDLILGQIIFSSKIAKMN